MCIQIPKSITGKPTATVAKRHFQKQVPPFPLFRSLLAGTEIKWWEMSSYFLMGTGALKQSEFKNLGLFKFPKTPKTTHHVLLTLLQCLEPKTMIPPAPPTSADY